MKQDWLTIEEFQKGYRVLLKCAKEAEGEIIIPEGVTVIADGSFMGCDKITSLVLPESLTGIEASAFYNTNNGKSWCPSLVSIHFPSSLLSPNCYMDENTMLWGTGWYDNQPDGVVYAGANAIGYKGKMPKNAEIVIKEGTKFISAYAFKDCYNLVSITLPESLAFIDVDAFLGCSFLKTIKFSSNVKLSESDDLKETPWYINQPDGVVYAGANAIGYKGDMPEGTEIVIKEGTKFIPFRAFALQKNLEKVTLPQSIVEIGIEAFEDCDNLKTICIPKMCKIEYIGESSKSTHPFRISQMLFESGLQKTEWVLSDNFVSYRRSFCQK